MIHFDRSRVLADVAHADRQRRERALDLCEAALEAVEPEKTTREAIGRIGALDGATLFAFGKASMAMARAALGSVRLAGGIVLALEPEALPGLDVLRACHPLPCADAATTGARVLARAAALEAHDTALCLVSGGGSAMLELPRPGVGLNEIETITRALMHAGADIAELNTVRGALSELKCGGLAQAIAPARIANVILSDVPGHPPSRVASGPTCAPIDGLSASTVLERYGLADAISSGARRAIAASAMREMPSTIMTQIAADNASARRAVIERGRDLAITERSDLLRNEARELGAKLVNEAGERAWVGGGETTVTVRGSGRGGRNQELVLGALAAGLPRGLLLAFGTDGVDGSSDAAGALIDLAAIERARTLGLDPENALSRNDSHAFFDALGTSLCCGPTGTNVADLCLYLP